MNWQPAAETLIERLTGPTATVVDLADCLRLTSAVLAALTRKATGADGLLLDAAVWDVDAARAHLGDQPGAPLAGAVAPLGLDDVAAPDALALCRRLLSAAVNAMDHAEDVAARQAVSSADRYLTQIAG